MARFVDLDEEDSQAQPMAAWHDAGRPLALGDNGAAVMVVGDGIPPARRFPSRKSTMTEKLQQENASASGEGKELMAHSAMGEAFQCYPYAIHPFLTHSAKKTRLTLDFVAIQRRLWHCVPHRPQHSRRIGPLVPCYSRWLDPIPSEPHGRDTALLQGGCAGRPRADAAIPRQSERLELWHGG